MQKPQHTLTQLEEEPQTAFYGCTHSEVVRVLRFSMLSVLVGTIFSLPFMPWMVGGVLSLFIGVGVFNVLIRKASKNRADKPLFYHKHISTYKTSQFIQGKKQYQIERNSNDAQK